MLFLILVAHTSYCASLFRFSWEKSSKITNNKLIRNRFYHFLFSALCLPVSPALPTGEGTCVYVSGRLYPLPVRPDFRSSLLPFMYYTGSWVIRGYGGAEHQKD
jgi:hypothetical protein